jgi:hypothetical protein
MRSNLALVQPPPIVEPDVSEDRRVHERRLASELAWLSQVRIKYGPDVSLIDLSAGGAQIEIDGHALRPGSNVVIEIMGGGRATTIPAQVLRCHLASLQPRAAYRGALIFKRPFDFPEVQDEEDAGDSDCNPFHEFARLSVALKRLSGNVTVNKLPIGTAALDAAHAIIESARRRPSAIPAANEIGRLMRLMALAIDGEASSEPITAQVVQRLRRLVPSRAVRIVDADAALRSVDDSIYFDVPSPHGQAARLLVEFPPECAIQEWHFQLLQGAAQLLGVTRDLDAIRDSARPAAPAASESVGEVEDKPAASTAGGKRLVVRYLDGRLLKGYGAEFQPTSGAIHLWTDPNAPNGSKVIIPLHHLKAVFFVHDFEGNPSHVLSPLGASVKQTGRRIIVTFVDGEVVEGTTLSYAATGPGFFVTPTNSKTNNLKIFVTSVAVRHVQFP